MSVQVLHCNKTYAYFHIGFCKVNKQYDDDCENAITWQLVSSRVLNQNYSSSISIISPGYTLHVINLPCPPFA